MNPEPLLIVVTPTYCRRHQAAQLSRCAAVFRNVTSLLWLVVQDGEHVVPEISRLLRSSGVDFRYWAAGATADKGNLQRNSAFEYIVANGLDGVVYNADDDNIYLPALFGELRKVERVAVLPVGNRGCRGPNGVERPLVNAGKVTGWDACWTSRKFPVDMAGFAFRSSLLGELSYPLWDHKGIGGESEFLSRLIKDESELEVLADACRDVLVWHNAADGLIQPAECSLRPLGFD